MKKIILALFVCVVSTALYAAGEVIYDGIYYSVGGDTATVLQQSKYWEPVGDIVIPEEIKDESGKIYTVTELGDNAFYNTSIETISIPGTIKTWGNNCVNYCRSLTKVTFGDDITSIGYCAFNQCYLLETVNLAYTKVERIEQQGFSLCSALTTILLPSTLTYLGNWVFMSCSNVESLTCMALTPPELSENDPFMNFPTSTCVLYVPIGCAEAYRAATGWSAFENIEEIEDIGELPLTNGDKIDVDDLFYKIVSIDNATVEVTWGGTSGSAGTASYAGNITIPAAVTYDDNTFDVIGIGESAFRGNAGLTGVTIPENITYIKSYAFEDCTGLTAMTLPNSVAEFGDGLFEGCTSMTSVSLPDNLTAIGNRVFYGCSQLPQLDIPSTVTTIGGYTFYGCGALTQLSIPSSVTSIGNYAFGRCDALTELTIPDNVTSIGNYLLYNCQALEKVTIGNGLTATSSYMFDSCPALTDVAFAASVTTLTDNTFKSCTGLRTLTLPSSITTIEEYVFSRCSNLTTVTLPENITSLGMYTFARCASLSSITIPATITTIAEHLCSWCEGLTQVSLPETLTSIDADAFCGCTTLSEITLPSAVALINNYAFDGCIGLTQITSLNPEPPTCGVDVFRDVDKKSCLLMVPEGTVNTYAAADTWEEFLYISDGIVTTGIDSAIATEQAEVSGYYTIDGRALNAPQRGITIVRYTDGTVKKVFAR